MKFVPKGGQKEDSMNIEILPICLLDNLTIGMLNYAMGIKNSNFRQNNPLPTTDNRQSTIDNRQLYHIDQYHRVNPLIVHILSTKFHHSHNMEKSMVNSYIGIPVFSKIQYNKEILA